MHGKMDGIMPHDGNSSHRRAHSNEFNPIYINRCVYGPDQTVIICFGRSGSVTLSAVGPDVLSKMLSSDEQWVSWMLIRINALREEWALVSKDLNIS